MILGHHFIFASVDLKKKKGYQIVSKSSGITTKLLSKLESYLYPEGGERGNFLESRSMLLIDDKIVYTKTKNIGIGYDGRPNTIYSHTIAINKEDFKELQFDTRIFESFYIEDKEQKYLSPIKIENIELKPDFSCIDTCGITQFEDFLKAIFLKKRIGIINNKDQTLIQSLLSLLPPSLRIIPFSTVVMEPRKQTKFQIIQTDLNKISLLKYCIINSEEKKSIQLVKNKMLEQCIYYLRNVVISKDVSTLTEIHNVFENITLKNNDEKFLIAIIIAVITKHSTVLDRKIIQKFLLLFDKTSITFQLKYFSKLKLMLPTHIKMEYSLYFEIYQFIVKHSRKITYQDVINIFDRTDNLDSESRCMLFNKLVESRSNKSKKVYNEILIHMINTQYKSDIITCFIQNEFLHACIFEILENQDVIYQIKKKIFKEVTRQSIYNDIIMEQLFTFNIFELTDENELLDYHDIIIDLFISTKFHIYTNIQIIYNITNQIYRIIYPRFLKKQKYNSTSRRYMQDIIFVLLNTMKYILLFRKFESKNLQAEIIENINKFEQLLKINRLANKHTLPLFVITDDVPTPLLRTLFNSVKK